MTSKQLNGQLKNTQDCQLKESFEKGLLAGEFSSLVATNILKISACSIMKGVKTLLNQTLMYGTNVHMTVHETKALIITLNIGKNTVNNNLNNYC